MTFQSEAVDNAGLADVSPPSSVQRKIENLGEEFDKINVRYLAEAEIYNAVELSIAASEALVIHDVVNGELEAAAVLEATLHVKRARLQDLNSTSLYPTEEIDEIDSLSDLDDLTMLAAFADVGFIFCGPGHERIGGTNVSTVLAMGKENNPASGMLVSSSAGQIDASVHEASEDISQFSPVEQVKEDYAVQAELNKKSRKGILKPLVQQTSFFSESADAAPDEYSHVQKYETGCRIASQHSVHFDDFSDRADEAVLGLQDVISFETSLIDPLCSVVPCSISPENESSFQASDQKLMDASAENCFGSAPRFGKESFLRLPNLEVQSLHEDGQAVPTSTVDHAQSLVKTKSTSMNTYSRPVSKGSAVLCLERETFESLLPLKRMSEHPLGGENNQQNHSDLFTEETVVQLNNEKDLQMQTEFEDISDTQVPVRKRVHFSEVEVELHQEEVSHKLQDSHRTCFITAGKRRKKYSKACSGSRIIDSGRCSLAHQKHQKRLIFQGLEFLLTGFSNRKQKEIERLIREYGGAVLWDIPSPCSVSRRRIHSKSGFEQLPIILSSKKLQTTKFLYGCAVNAFVLKAKWLTHSIAAGSAKPPERYMIIPRQINFTCPRDGKPVHRGNINGIFDGLGVMLCGKHRFCAQLAMTIKHGEGCVFNSLHRLVQSLDLCKICVGAIVAEDERKASRHLRQCALERKIPVMPASWIVKSLYLGKLLPVSENKQSCPAKAMARLLPPSPEGSEEI